MSDTCGFISILKAALNCSVDKSQEVPFQVPKGIPIGSKEFKISFFYSRACWNWAVGKEVSEGFALFCV